MPFKIIFLEEFGKAFVPKRVIPNLRRYLLKAGINKVPYKFFGALFYLSSLITAIIYILILYPYFSDNFDSLYFFISSFVSWLVIQLFLVTVFILLIYFYVDLKIFTRTRKMEETLADFLQVVSSHLKSGLTLETSLWAAIKPRFSVLANEIAEVSKKVMTGEDLDQALIEFSEKYDSPMLRRAIDLIIGELASGGNIADIIDKVVSNLKETKLLKEEMSASAVAYIIFLSAIIIFVAPLLFALSLNLLVIIQGFLLKLIAITQRVQKLPFTLSEIKINIDHFKIFSITALSIIALFSSMIVSIVEKGDIKAGLKYIPIFLFGSVAVYLVFLKILSFMFGSLV